MIDCELIENIFPITDDELKLLDEIINENNHSDKSEEIIIKDLFQYQERINNYYRANGKVICNICGKTYDNHPTYEPSGRLSYDGHPFLNEICNGDLVKL